LLFSEGMQMIGSTEYVLLSMRTICIFSVTYLGASPFKLRLLSSDH
jgi:hypothetical protein